MIIQDTIIRPNGDIEVVEREVADNYFDNPVNTADDAKATALSAIEKATTIAGLRTAMLNYIDVAGIG